MTAPEGPASPSPPCSWPGYSRIPSPEMLECSADPLPSFLHSAGTVFMALGSLQGKVPPVDGRQGPSFSSSC